MTGEPLFLWVFDTAVNVAIDTFWQKSEVSGIVCKREQDIVDFGWKMYFFV